MWNENRKLSMIVSQRLKIKLRKASCCFDRHRMEEENSGKITQLESFLGLTRRSRNMRLGREISTIIYTDGKFPPKASRTISLRHHPFWFRVCLESSCWDKPRKVSAKPRCTSFRWPIAWWRTSECPRADRTHAGSSAATLPTARCAGSLGTSYNSPKTKERRGRNFNFRNLNSAQEKLKHGNRDTRRMFFGLELAIILGKKILGSILWTAPSKIDSSFIPWATFLYPNANKHGNFSDTSPTRPFTRPSRFLSPYPTRLITHMPLVWTLRILPEFVTIACFKLKYE